MAINDDISPAVVRLDMAILAHNERRDLPKLLEDLSKQTLLADPEMDIRISVLANGCTDDTVDVARAKIASLPNDLTSLFEVVDRPEPGKSRTMNWFLHNRLRPEADLVMFVDGDIRLPVTSGMARMASELRCRPELIVFTSRPVKDIVHEKIPLGPVARAIASGREGLTDFRRSIAGSLFVMRTEFARRLWIPAGLPVEDGFIRGMILTEFLSRSEDLSRIDGSPEVFHIYESVRTVRALVQHQTRIVLGSAINAALYRHMRSLVRTAPEAEALLHKAASDDEWMTRMLAEELPCAPYGYIPFRFMTKRLTVLGRTRKITPRALLMLGPGLVLDAVAWVRASLRMARASGVGYW